MITNNICQPACAVLIAYLAKGDLEYQSRKTVQAFFKKILSASNIKNPLYLWG